MPESSSTFEIPGYKLLKKIGVGGMATVYKARQLSLDRIVAVKILSNQLTKRAGYVDRFYAEGRAAAKLNHPNIVAALDVGESQGRHYFVMEYVEGESVYDKLMEIVRFDEQTAIKIIYETARGLEHAHQAGLVHRDVKPQNIMLTLDGVAKLADMGLAHDIHDDTPDIEQLLASGTQHVVLGSPYYISPEQIRFGHKVDFRADLYSLGATLFCMITGNAPFKAPTAKEVIKMHLGTIAPSPKEFNARISDELCEIVAVLLAKKKEDRYDSTKDLLADLKALKNDEIPLKAHFKLGVELPESSGTPSLSSSSHGETYSHMVAEMAENSRKSKKRKKVGSPLLWIAIAGWVLAILFAILWATA